MGILNKGELGRCGIVVLNSLSTQSPGVSSPKLRVTKGPISMTLLLGEYVVMVTRNPSKDPEIQTSHILSINSSSSLTSGVGIRVLAWPGHCGLWGQPQCALGSLSNVHFGRSYPKPTMYLLGPLTKLTQF